MENFEYSIQRNDRDWAEFYVASEECGLIQAALATAEEPLPSDLEDGEVESRSARGRVIFPSPASCPTRGAPRGHLLAEEVLSGSEDETDLGSVSRFLHDYGQASAAFPRPSASELLGGRQELPELARECEASFAAEGRESETGDGLAASDRSLPEVDVAVQKAEVQGQISGPEAMEKPTCSVPMNVDALKVQSGEHGSRPLGLERQPPTNDISPTASVDIRSPLPVGSNAVCGEPEPPASKDPNVHPTSSSFPSGEAEGAEHPEMGTKRLQGGLKAEAPTFQEKPSLFRGHSVSPLGTLAPSGPPPESRKEGVLESRSNKEEKAADLQAEGQPDQREDLVDGILKEGGHVDQEISSVGCRVNLQKAPGEPETSKCPRPTIVSDSRRSGTLDRHTEAAVLKAETQKDGTEEPCRRLGPAVPFEGESPSTARERQRSNFLEENIPYCPALENSLEGHLAVTTWPQDDDRFVCGDAREHGEKMPDRVVEKRLDVGQDLPEMYGPEMYEYFFADVEGARVGEGGGEKDTGRETPSSSDQPLAPSPGSQDSDSAMLISIPEVYEHFFNNGAQGRKSWKRLFLTMPASEARNAVRALKSLLSKPAHLLRRHPPSPGTPLRRGSRGKLVVFSPRLLEESQPRPEDLRMAVMSPERPLQLALTHRDVCLGFVAFASWAVKTSNLQAPDAWKIVFLANFGALSAIRYFRRQIVAGGEHGT